jgi:hypothetical protein
MSDSALGSAHTLEGRPSQHVRMHLQQGRAFTVTSSKGKPHCDMPRLNGQLTIE